MQFFQLVTRGQAHNQAVINTFWYARAISTPPVAGDLTKLIDAWLAVVDIPFRSVLNVDYSLDEVHAYAYDDNFQREPYLPEIRVVNATGAQAGVAAPLYVSLVLSFKLEPERMQIVTRPPLASRIRHVRRGYLSLSPITASHFAEDGGADFLTSLSPAAGNLLTAVKATLTHTAGLPAVEQFRPIRAGAHHQWVDQRGFGWVVDALWRKYGSTRRSRMKGRGS